jgi:Bacterial PH domain
MTQGLDSMRRYGIRLTDTGCAVAGAPRWIPFVLGALLIVVAPMDLVIGDTGTVDVIIAVLFCVMAVIAIRLSIQRVTIGVSGVHVRNIFRSRMIPWSKFKGFAGRSAPILGKTLVLETNDGTTTPIQLAPTRTVFAAHPDIDRLVEHLDTVVVRVRRSE